jgi:hypothetical protein
VNSTLRARSVIGEVGPLEFKRKLDTSDLAPRTVLVLHDLQPLTWNGKEALLVGVVESPELGVGEVLEFTAPEGKVRWSRTQCGTIAPGPQISQRPRPCPSSKSDLTESLETP